MSKTRARAATPPNKDFPETTKDNDPVRVPRASRKISLTDGETTADEQVSGEGTDEVDEDGNPIAPPLDEADPELEDPELEEKRQAVEDAAANVAEAKQQLDAANEEHRVATEEHAKAVKALEPKVDPAKHIMVDSGRSGSYSVVDAPLGTDGQPMLRERAINLGGVNHEHTDDHVVYDDEGKRLGVVWCYRAM